jgi:hypothetical protein
MEESPQSYPASSRRKFRTPPLLPEDTEQPGINLGAFFPSFLPRQRLDAELQSKKPVRNSCDPLGSKELRVSRRPAGNRCY